MDICFAVEYGADGGTDVGAFVGLTGASLKEGCRGRKGCYES